MLIWSSMGSHPWYLSAPVLRSSTATEDGESTEALPFDSHYLLGVIPLASIRGRAPPGFVAKAETICL